MAGSPGTYENIKEVALYVNFNWRGSSKGIQQSDAWAKNVFVEKDGGSAYSVKRPGMSLWGQMAPSGLTAPYNIQGAFAINEAYGLSSVPQVLAIVNDQPLLLPTGINMLTIAPYTITGSATPSGNWYTAADVTAQQVTITGSSTMFAVLQSAAGVYTGKYTWAYGSHRYIAAFTTATPSSNLLVPGIACLDNTYYVMDCAGVIWASAIGDSTTWPAINYVQADPSIGLAIAFTRYQNYLVAMGTLGIQLWYDAGVSPGAPIAAVQGGLFLSGISAAAPFSVVTTDDALIWLGSSGESDYAIKMLKNSSIGNISNEGVERFLEVNFQSIPTLGAQNTLVPQFTQQASSVYIRGGVLRSAGHQFYLLTCQSPTASAAGTGGVTLAYDLVTGQWAPWTQQTSLPYGEGGLRGWNIIPTPSGNAYTVDCTSGAVLQFSTQAYQDNGQPINVLIQTDLYSWGNQRTKLIAATYPLLDTVNTTVNLSWTDDDYTTFITPQPISAATAKKQLIRCGSTVQRAWQLTHTDNTPMRFYALEVEVIPGAL